MSVDSWVLGRSILRLRGLLFPLPFSGWHGDASKVEVNPVMSVNGVVGCGAAHDLNSLKFRHEPILNRRVIVYDEKFPEAFGTQASLSKGYFCSRSLPSGSSTSARLITRLSRKEGVSRLSLAQGAVR